MNHIRRSALIITIVVIAAYCFAWYPLELLELKAYDIRARAAQPEASSEIVIVAIDDASIGKIGRWPWPRAVIADAVDLLARHDAKVIGIDLLYPEEELSQGLTAIRSLKGRLAKDAAGQKSGRIADMITELHNVEQRLDSDAILAAALRESKRVVLPFSFDLSAGGDISAAPQKHPPHLKANARTGSGIPFPSAGRMMPPIEVLAAQSSGLGHRNLQQDADGVVRRGIPFVAYQGQLYPSFAVQIARQYLRIDLQRIGLDDSIMTIGASRLTIDERGSFLIAYAGRPAAATYSFDDVLNGKVAPSAFRNKIVLIGITASGAKTVYETPVNPAVASVDLHAQEAGALLGNHAFARPSWTFPLELGVMVLMGGFLAFALPRLPAGRGALLSLFIVIAWSGIAFSLFITQGIWLKMVYPTLLMTAGYLGTMLCRCRGGLMSEPVQAEAVATDRAETDKAPGHLPQEQAPLDQVLHKCVECPELPETAGVTKAADEVGLDGDLVDISESVDTVGTKTMIGRYEIIRELGRGAMGMEYLGRDPKTGIELVIRTLRYDEVAPELLADAKRSFFHEAASARRLSHPAIVTIYDAGEDFDMAYLTMEVLDGKDLTERCRKEHLLPVGEVVRIISRVAEALDYAHVSGVVHRAVRPDNIVLLASGDIKVKNFGAAGVAALSRPQTGDHAEVSGYLSPEQITGSKVDGRSDIFSLGVVFFELLTGGKPFQGDSISSLMYDIAVTEQPRFADLRSDVPTYCDIIIAKMLAKEPEQRYQMSCDVVTDLAMATMNA